MRFKRLFNKTMKLPQWVFDDFYGISKVEWLESVMNEGEMNLTGKDIKDTMEHLIEYYKEEKDTKENKIIEAIK